MPTHVNGKPVKTGSWTAQEDKLLGEWQAKLGNRWSSVAKKIAGRTGQQCAQRWRHKVNPNIRKEKWTEEEDRRLLKLVRQFGNCWAEISRRLDGRTDQQCMGRWRRHLDPSIRRDAWQPQEDAALQTLYLEYGSQWSAIAHGIHGRTAQQCRARFFQIEGESGTPRQRKRGPADSDEDEQPSDAEEAGPDFAAQHRAARSRARKRARRAPSPSLSPFEDEEEPEDDLGPEQGRECADDSQQPSPELPTDGVTAGGRIQHAASNGGFTRSGRRVTAHRTASSEGQQLHISERKLSTAVSAALQQAQHGTTAACGRGDASDASPPDHLTSSSRTPTTLGESASEGRRSSLRRSSGRKRASIDPSPPFLSPMRNCHSMPSESQLLGPKGFDDRSPQSVRLQPSGAALANGYAQPAEHAEEEEEDDEAAAAEHQPENREVKGSHATPVGPQRSHRGTPAQGTNGHTRWRTASPGMNILQLLQSPHHTRDGFADSPKLGDKGLITPEWAKQKGRELDEAFTAPAQMQPDSGRGSRGPVARRLNIDQAFKGSAGGKKPVHGVPRTVPQECMGGGPRRLGVSPAKRLRMASPRSNPPPSQREQDTLHGDADALYADSAADMDFDELREQERRKVRMDKENKGACNALQQLCVAAAAAEEAHQDQANAAAAAAAAADGLHDPEADDQSQDCAEARNGHDAGAQPSSHHAGGTMENGHTDAGWLARLAGADGGVQATIEARDEPKAEVVPNGKLGTSSHLRMRLHALLEDLAGVI